MRRRLFPVHAAILGGYIVLTLLLTWPLVIHFATHVPGDGIDDPSLAWNLWWVKARLIDLHTVEPSSFNITSGFNLDSFPVFDIFHVDWMFFPIGINLGFYTLTPLNGLLSVPLQTALSLIVASNVILLSSYVLGGYGTFLLVRYLLGKDRQALSPQLITLCAFAAGIVYAFASSKLFYTSLGQFNISSSQWIPFVVLYTLRTAERRRARDAVLAGIFLTFQAWAELTYASFLLILIALVFVWQLVASAQVDRPARLPAALAHSLRRLYPSFLLMGMVTLLGLLPFLWAMAPDLLAEGDFFGSGGGFADIFSADLLGYLLPTRLHPLFGAWTAQLPFPNDKGQQIYIGYSALIVAVVGTASLWRRQGWRGLLWPLLTLWFAWLTLGAEARWNGETLSVPGPFALISRLPFFSGNRYPSRYSVLLMLCVAVLVGYGLRKLADVGEGRRRQLSLPILCSAFMVVFLFEHLSAPLPLSDFRVPSIYREIAAEAGDFTLLELPTGWRNGARVMGRSDVLIMMQQWYQTVHEKRRLGGNTSRNPDYKFQYFAEAPLIGDLIRLMNADAQIDGRAYLAPAVDAEWTDLVGRNQAIAPWVLDQLNVRYVTLHLEKSPPALIRFVEEALPVAFVDQWQGVDWAGAPATIRRYRVLPVNDRSWEVDAGSAVGKLTAAEGWSAGGVDGRIRYALRPQVDLLLDLPATGATLTLELYGPGRLTDLSLHGRSLPWQVTESGDDAQIVEVTVPPALAVDPIDRLALHFDGLHPLSAVPLVDGDGWSIGATGVRLPVDRPLYVRSAGKDAGDFAHIFLAGRQVAQNQLGYNLIALDDTGQLLESVVFNTLISPSESASMAEWIAQWPAGTIIAGAVRDEASYNLGQDAVDALQRLGVTTDLRGAFRGSHAFIAVVGAPEGSALDSFSAWAVAEAAAGPPIDAEWISGGVGRIHLSEATGY